MAMTTVAILSWAPLLVSSAVIRRDDSLASIVNGMQPLNILNNVLTDLKFEGEPDTFTFGLPLGNIGPYARWFPQCTVDPSYSQGQSAFKDGDGFYLQSACDNGYDKAWNNGWHCWTDLFLVDQQAGYAGWHNTGSVVDCKSTSSCSQTEIKTGQTCTTNFGSNTHDFGPQLEANLPWMSNRTKLSFHYDHTINNGNATQTCTTESTNVACTWNDGGCHAIWSAKRNIRYLGYLRRSCNSPRDGTNIPRDRQVQRPDTYYTVGMQDYSFDIPDNRIIGCAAKCGDLSYPDPTPGDDPIHHIPVKPLPPS